MDLNLFRNPTVDYRGTDLWMMNTIPEPESIDRELREMASQGIGTVIARTYNGHISDYPGPKYHAAIRRAIDTAGELGMHIYLQAGYMPSGVPDLPDDCRLQNLYRAKEEDYTGEGEEFVRKDGYVYYLKKSEAILDMLSPKAVDYYTEISYSRMWNEFRDAFGKVVTSVWVDEPYLSPNELAWTGELPSLYAKTYGHPVEDDIQWLFEEAEQTAVVRYRYKRLIGKMMDDAYFTAIANWCRKNGLSFSGHLMGEDTLYHQTGFGAGVMQHYKYFDVPGIDFLCDSLFWHHGVGNTMTSKAMLFVTTPLQCSSAAHQAGREEVLCEMYGVSTQDLTLERQRAYYDHMAVLGINRKCIHAIFSSLKGQRKYLYTPEIFYQQPYWSRYKAFTDYQARCSVFNRQGKPCKEILMIHPGEDYFMHFNAAVPFNIEDTSANSTREVYFNELLCDLLHERRQFDLGDEETMSQWGKILEKKLNVGEMSYQAVIVPAMNSLRRSTVLLLLQFAQQGGTVIFLRTKPNLVEAIPDTEGDLDALLNTANVYCVSGYTELSQLLNQHVSSPVSVEVDPNADLWMSYRKDQKNYYMFLYNRGDSEAEVQIHADGMCWANEWDAEKGECRALKLTLGDDEDDSSLMHRIPAGRAMMIEIGCEEVCTDTASYEKEYGEICRIIPMEKGWEQVEQSASNAMLLEFCRYRLEGETEWSREYPLVAVSRILKKSGYQGKLELKFSITADDVPDDVSLVLEEMKSFEGELNGKVLPLSAPDGWFVDRDFDRLSLKGMLQKGVNTLILRTDFRQPQKAINVLFRLFRDTAGTELANPYLVGDFSVKVTQVHSNTSLIRISPDYAVAAKNAADLREVTTSGYPFYAGSLTFRKTVELKEAGSYVLSFAHLNGACAEVSVNGSEKRLVMFRPYTLDISDLLTEGENTIEVTITNTLYNLLGPWHYPGGERQSHWQEPCWTGATDNRYEEEVWYPGKYLRTPGWICDDHLKPTGITGITLTQYEMQ